MKELGVALYKDISCMDVPYVIDRNAKEIVNTAGLKIITPDEYTAEMDVDLVIVTAIHSYKAVFLDLWKRKNYVPIISLDYLIKELLISQKNRAN